MQTGSGFLSLVYLVVFYIAQTSCSSKIEADPDLAVTRHAIEVSPSPEETTGSKEVLSQTDYIAKNESTKLIDELDDITKQQYKAAWRDAAKRALKIQRSAVKRLKEKKQAMVDEGIDENTLSKVEQDIVSLEESIQKMESRL